MVAISSLRRSAQHAQRTVQRRQRASRLPMVVELDRTSVQIAGSNDRRGRHRTTVSDLDRRRHDGTVFGASRTQDELREPALDAVEHESAVFVRDGI